MNIFKVIYSYFYFLFVKIFYKKANEEIYHRKYKYVIEVKDDEVGSRLYEVVKSLKSTLIDTPLASFKFTQYGLGLNNTVKWICVQGYSRFTWEDFPKFEKLKQIQHFVDVMQANGFVLDDTKFNASECKSVSEFLSFFIQSDEQDMIERSKGCMIRYIHYVCSDGGALKEFYEDFSNKVLYETDNVPYNGPIMRMCYDYFSSGTTPASIMDVLYKERPKNYGDRYLVVIPEKLGEKFNVTEKTEEYTIYDGCLKIYHNLSSEHQSFMTKSLIFDLSGKASLEQVEAIIVDLDNQIIGYKFVKADDSNMKTSFVPTSQKEIFNFINQMCAYFRRYNMEGNSSKCNDFEIENCLVYTFERCNAKNNFTFKSKTVKDLINLTNIKWSVLKEQVTVLFFKLLANFMAEKYGKLTSREQFFEKNEVRFLSPIVANEFVNFALGNQVILQVAVTEFFKLLDARCVSSEKDFCYDTRFCYSPSKVHFTFDYEAEKKYNAKLEKGTTEMLPDGRMLVTFKRSRKISAFAKHEEGIRKDMMNLGGNVEDENVKLAGLSEIIVDAQRLNPDNMYNVVGYIAGPIKGKQLTDEAILQLDNRDLLKVAAYLFSKFSSHYIPWKYIWMDSEFMFYINYLDEDFQVERTPNKANCSSAFVQWVFDYLQEVGYNPNAFIDLQLPDGGGCASVKKYLLNLVNRFNKYCDEHKIYYEARWISSYKCPVCVKTKYFVPQDFENRYTKVFEDSVADHYQIAPSLNLKVYKPAYKNEMKEQVSRLVSLRLRHEDVALGIFQDCFVPWKSAFDANNQFIGYVYKATKFAKAGGNLSDACVDLEDVENLRNKARLKSLIRLIMQVKQMEKDNWCFIRNPFGQVFLNTSHKKQVQILNMEFICSGFTGNPKNTEIWTRDYIYKVLKSDTTIEYKYPTLPEEQESLDTILHRLTELDKQMTEYCSIHKIHYKNSYIYCPKCVNPATQPKNAISVQKSVYSSQIPINEGGEAFIYKNQSSYDSVVKVFKNGDVDINFKAAVIFRILSKKDLLEKVNQEKHKYRYVYPKQVLIDRVSKQIFGYTMDRVVNGYPISILRDKNEVERLGLSRQDIFEIIITIGEGIEMLHKHNIYIGDLNGRNILFDVKKNVYFLDFDGMGVDELAPEFCTDGYIDPLSKKNRSITMKDDWYSFAVQTFHYLTYTHPFNGIYYVQRNGRRVLLEIPDKMERRISLLGKHGMQPPAIAVSWDWMNADLKSVFLNIFEGEYRESIVPYLKKQYQTLYVNKIIRINPKFVAKELDVFAGNVVNVLNPYAAICENGIERFIATRKSSNIHVPIYLGLNDCLFSEDGKIAFVVYNGDKVTVVDVERDKIIHCETIPGATNVVVNDRTLYYTGESNGNSVIFKRTFQPNGKIVKETIGFGTQRIKWFNVQFNTKFILITQATQNTDELYCNSEKFLTFEYDSAEIAIRAKYNVLYDDATKSWLVVNNFGKAIVIQMSGAATELDISKYINDFNFENIYFEKGNVYIPNEESLYIVNVNREAVKRMKCHKIMTSKSRICEINSEGFSVITQDILYEVRKG